ncbi:MAG: hypothetical protein QM784_11675 [Polyangiaceae bacterium]
MVTCAEYVRCRGNFSSLESFVYVLRKEHMIKLKCGTPLPKVRLYFSFMKLSHCVKPTRIAHAFEELPIAARPVQLIEKL